MHRWRNEPHVLRWYYDYEGEAPTHAYIEAHYAGLLDGTDPTRAFIIVLDDRDIGYIQSYALHDWEPYAREIGVTENATGIDLFIGEPDLVHRGLGPRVIEAFVRAHVFSDPEVQAAIISPEVNNTAAIRCYEKAGFTHLRTVPVRGEPQPQYVMRRARPNDEA